MQHDPGGLGMVSGSERGERVAAVAGSHANS